MRTYVVRGRTAQSARLLSLLLASSHLNHSRQLLFPARKKPEGALSNSKYKDEDKAEERDDVPTSSVTEATKYVSILQSCYAQTK